MANIQLTLTQEQATAVCEALDAYNRLCMGQIEEVANLVRYGVIPVAQHAWDKGRAQPTAEVCDEIQDHSHRIKALLGLSRNAHFGIGSPHLAMNGRRSYEVQKVLSKALAELRDPNPEFRSVDYDGLGPRYTSDPAPTAVAIDEILR
jgi:hypothetical protein